jgi:tetratricopeptide (TPR) repeat protein
LNDLAVVYAGLGRGDEARAVFKQLLDRNSSSATTWFNLGLFELQHRRRAEAIDAFRRATSNNAGYGEEWHALGAARGRRCAWRDRRVAARGAPASS